MGLNCSRINYAKHHNEENEDVQHFSSQSLQQFDALRFTPTNGKKPVDDLPDFLQSSHRKTPRPLFSDSFSAVSSPPEFDHLSFSDLSDSMLPDPNSSTSDTTVYVSSATPLPSRSQSFQSTPVKSQPRDFQTEILDKAAEFRKQGNEHFENKEYSTAVELYSMAISYVPSDYVSYSTNIVFAISTR